jgi:NAD(P)H-dependent flavin oxidoreductase YrpB (nitropropane dioxygenase family)
MAALGKPFWQAGAYGSPEGLQRALAEGASGIQVGTLFALCEESGFPDGVRRALVGMAVNGGAEVFTHPDASPTGFPFKVVPMEGTLSEHSVYEARRRICDLGALRDVYRREDGTIGYRCPAEPTAAYVAKGGEAEETRGRRCLCNALVSNIGLPQALLSGDVERNLITLGDDVSSIPRLCNGGGRDYTAAQTIEFLLG